MNISVVVLTKNSSKTLEKCLESVTFCDEIVVIDDNSTDETKAIAKKYNAKIHEHPLENDFSAQRNFGLEKATSDWVLFVDSDEVVPHSLREEIKSIINHQLSIINGYYIRRVDYMWGRKLEHGETENMWLLRLAKKTAGKWEGKVHERWEIKGKTTRLENPIEHYPHPTISDFLSKINIYSTLRAEELHKSGVKIHWWGIILYPKAKFWLNYIVKLGYKDGMPGLIVALMMSFHSFLVRGKLWQLQDK